MFTGIIEEIGIIEKISSGEDSCSLTIRANGIFDDLTIGDSVAVNGVCLTATTISPPVFTADVMPETMHRTGFARLKKGSRVNLERAMQLNGRFGGHIVSGHIDGTGRILSMTQDDNAVWIRISADRRIIRYIIEKGSVTLDGISLTVTEVKQDSFAVSVIPHTAENTTLLNKRSGDIINIENDIIGKYVERLMQKQDNGITMEFLGKYGF